jgi:small subunit ribosomal protein S17
MGRPRKNEEEMKDQVEETPAEEPETADAAPAAQETEAEETVAEDAPVAEEALAEEPAEEPAPEPVAEEEPAAEAETPAEEPAAEEPPADEPAAEAEPALEEAAPAEVQAEAPVASAAPVAPEPKRKRKRVSRAERRQRSKPRRAKPAERKPIVRLPKPEHARGRRKERRGVVVSDAMEKTIVVRVDTVKPHPVYKKVVRRSTKLHAHDEANVAKIGDLVRLVETRPLSKSKSWRLAEVLEEAK